MSLVNHVGLTVSNLDASVAFYRDLVGMEVWLPRSSTGGPWFDTLTGSDRAAIDVVMLRAGGLVLQLVEYRSGGNPAAGTGHSRVGNLHLSINVDDVEAAHLRLSAADGHDPTPIVDLPVPGFRSFYGRDPDGVPVEFVQAGRAEG